MMPIFSENDFGYGFEHGHDKKNKSQDGYMKDGYMKDGYMKDGKKMKDCDCKHDKQVLARAYVPMQKLDKIYTAEEALFRGTVFPELYCPYEPEKTEKEVLMR